jgi:CBS domain-containing protein
MGTVRNILQEKGTLVHTASPDDSVYNALETLEDRNIGALVVMDDTKLIGIFTERDYARKIVLKGRSSKDTLVRDIMTDEVFYVTPETTVEGCMQIMTNKFIRHLPVMDCGRLVGIVSIGDLVKYIIGEKDFIIINLEHYITG